MHLYADDQIEYKFFLMNCALFVTLHAFPTTPYDITSIVISDRLRYASLDLSQVLYSSTRIATVLGVQHHFKRLVICIRGPT